ncbi:kinesin motor domain protein, partial [Ichthyophthirius multifiliis]
MQLNSLTDQEVINSLKQKALPVYGTHQERLERLKKANVDKLVDLSLIDEKPQQKKVQKISSTVEKILQMESKREERRQKMEEAKRDKEGKILENQVLGKNVDVDFQQLIKSNIFKQNQNQQQHIPSYNFKLCVCVRKRPIFQKEEQNGEIDSVSVLNPQIRVLAPKYKVDGITKYVEKYNFQFDNVFNENEDTQLIYQYSLKPLLDHILDENWVITCFAYGQTGSGKTYTMKGTQDLFVKDLFIQSQRKGYQQKFFLSFFEIYGGKCLDLLNNKQNLIILEDKQGQVQIQNLTEKQVFSAEEMLEQIILANNERTTFATQANDSSSRSHAVCKIIIKDQKDLKQGQLILVDLAGSERAQDCQSNDKIRRMEGSEINKSLLALKECIRTMDKGGAHVPFRGSKLTMVLRDSFQGKNNKSKIIMIACISPCSSSTDHTINTLRYADRLKETKSNNTGSNYNIHSSLDKNLEIQNYQGSFTCK